jgi:butyryl-CoA dehydrogenase
MDESVSELGGEDTIDNFSKLLRTSPEKAAKDILRAVEGNHRRALIGPDAKVLDLISRLPAGIYQRVLVAGAKRRR